MVHSSKLQSSDSPYCLCVSPQYSTQAVSVMRPPWKNCLTIRKTQALRNLLRILMSAALLSKVPLSSARVESTTSQKDITRLDWLRKRITKELAGGCKLFDRSARDVSSSREMDDWWLYKRLEKKYFQLNHTRKMTPICEYNGIQYRKCRQLYLLGYSSEEKF